MIKPYFYDDFHCTADACRFTCCDGWDIELNSEACIRHQNEGRAVPEGTMRCPFYNEQGLCDIVLKEGEDAIPETCHLFPRLQNDWGEWEEATLSFACPAVCDLLWTQSSSQKPVHSQTSLYLTADSPAEKKEVLEQTKEDRGFLLREQMMTRMLDPRQTAAQSMQSIFHLLNEALKVVPKHAQTEAFSPREQLRELSGLFQDVVLDYQYEKKYEAILPELVHFLLGHGPKKLEKSWELFQAAVSTPDINQFFSEVYASKIMDACLCDEARDCMISFEILAIEFAISRFSLFLKLLAQGHAWTEPIPREWISESVVIYSRIIGHNGDAMEEFLEESYPDALWTEEYACLLLI